MKKNIREYIDCFLKMEEDGRLFDISIENVFIWQYIREGIYSLIYGKVVASKSDVNPTYITENWVIRNIHKLNEFLWHNQYLFRHKDMIIIKHARKVLKNGKYICKYTESYIHSCPYSNYVFEYPYLEEHKGRTPAFHTRFLLHEYLFKHMYKKQWDEEQVQKAVNDIFQAICKAFDKMTGRDVRAGLESRIRGFLNSYVGLIKYYDYILRRVRPKVILIADEYDAHNPYIIYCAKQRGIITIGMQHSTITELHRAYNYPPGSMGKVEVFPDYLFVWGECFKNSARYPIANERIVVTGFDYLEKNALAYYKDEDKSEIRAKSVLFIAGNQGMARMAVELAEKISDCKVAYRLHPAQIKSWKKEFAVLLNTPVKVNDNYNEDLYGYIREFDFVVCAGSTVAYEALVLRKRVILATVDDYENNLYMAKEVRVPIADTAEEIKCIMEDWENHPEIDYQKLLKKNAITNMNEAISKIMQQ